MTNLKHILEQKRMGRLKILLFILCVLLTPDLGWLPIIFYLIVEMLLFTHGDILNIKNLGEKHDKQRS